MNNPIIYNDPTGNWVDIAIIAGVCIVGSYMNTAVNGDDAGWNPAEWEAEDWLFFASLGTNEVTIGVDSENGGFMDIGDGMATINPGEQQKQKEFADNLAAGEAYIDNMFDNHSLYSNPGVGGENDPKYPHMGFFNLDENVYKELSEIELYSPLHLSQELYVTSPFGYRTDPITGEKSSFHYGTDYWSSQNPANVYSASLGKVIYTGNNKWLGNYVQVQHYVISKKTIVSTYAHLDSISVEKGNMVNNNTVLGIMGDTGNSTGRHLHFSVRYGDMYVDRLLFKNKFVY